jgi:hypothetical protein
MWLEGWSLSTGLLLGRLFQQGPVRRAREDLPTILSSRKPQPHLSDRLLQRLDLHPKQDCLDCIGDSDYEFVIWNLLIKKHKKLPIEPVDDTHKLRLHVAAFEYDPVNDDYKVLRIDCQQFLNSDDWALEALEVMVYI